MSRFASRFLVVAMATLLATGWLTARPGPVQAVSPNVVISEVYGGGGNSLATYTHDYIELFNRGSASQSLNGWSVQYASASGTGNFGSSATQQVDLPDVSIAPGQYYLIQEASTAAVGAALPAPDLIDPTPIAMAAGAGKVALVNTTTSLGCNGSVGQPCDPAALATIVDLVGYGSANFFEGAAAAPTLTNQNAAFRGAAGCTDTDQNGADFSAAVALARNSLTALNPCPSGITLSINDVSQPEGDSGTGTMNFNVSLSEPAGAGGVTFDIATSDNTATTDDGDYVAQSLTGQSIAAGETTYEFSAFVNGDTTPEPDETFFVNVTNVTGATLADGQGQGTLVNDDIAACGEAATFIHDIQGTGTSAAMTGTRTIEGIVVGDLQGAGQFGGYYVQEEDADADADPLTSEGIFVFNTATAVALGDTVRVTGTAGEFSGLTQLSSVTSTLICADTGASVTAASMTMPVAAVSDWERVEGMLVGISQELTVTEVFTLARFGEVALSVGGRLDNPTNVVEPGGPALALQDLNNRSRILLDDGNNQQNIDPTFYPQGGLSASNTLRVGDSLPSLTGVGDQRFGAYRIQPVDASEIEFSHDNVRPTGPAEVGGSLRVSAFNVLNYFNGDGAGGGFPTARGATSPAEFTRQRDKIITAMLALDADVVGLMELENDDTDAELGAIEDLVAGLNAASAPGTYDFIDTGVVGTDQIRVGILYQPASVTPIGTHAIIDSTVDSRFIDALNRPSIAQTFDEIATGARFTVVVNHLKSKGSDCNAFGDPDAADGQGNCNGVRTAAAEALVDWLAGDPTGSGDPDVIVLGDLNSYALEDPVDVFLDAGYVNTIAEFVGDHAYSFVFQGQSGYLDHALASPSLATQVTGVTEWHINADEPVALDYNVEFKSPDQVDDFYAPTAFRSSDHDPLLVGLFNAAPTISVSAGLSCLDSANGGTFALTVDDTDQGAAGVTLSLVDTTNGTLVPAGNVVFGGSGANRTISITAARSQSGSAVLTIAASDGFRETTISISVQVGTGADETLTGTAGADLLVGAGGNDSLAGLGGADVLCGGGGQDTASGGDDDDALEGGRGSDSLSGGEGNDVLRGGQGSDSLSGDGGDDTLTGGRGADAFSGGTGTDTNTDFRPNRGDTWDGT
jgi:predicted extracellular nuclease